MDGFNINDTVQLNVTKTVELVTELAANVSGVPSIVTLVPDIMKDLRTLNNLTRIIETTPILNFKDNIAWEPLERLLEALSLDEVIDIDVLKKYAANPNLVLQDVTGINITKIIEEVVDQILETTSIVPETVNISIKGYFPMLDLLGPYAFFPLHCYP